MRDNSIQRIGNYHLIQRLGKGAFAEVWLSEHIYLKTRAAIKMLHTELTSDALKNFMKEAQVLVGLKHPHIIRILDFGIEGKDTPYLVMEYATKGTMRDRHSKGSTVPLAVVASYVKQLTEALQYAHDQRYIHRDIKPENMLIGSADEILLSDFGIAAIAHRTGSLSPQEFSGTISYSAPEQIEDLPQPASDQYALAITVYEWLCGSVPFTGGGFTAIALKHLHESPQSLSQRVPIPPEVEQVVMKALEKSPKNRYPTIQMFAEALERASNRSQGIVSATTLAFCCSTCGNTLQPNHKFCSKCGALRDGMNTHDTDLVAPFTQAPTIATEGGVPQLEIKYKEYKLLATLFSLTWSLDGKHIAGVDVGDCYVWDAHTGETVSVHKIPDLFSPGFPGTCTWSPDRKRIVVASRIGTVCILDVYTGEEILVYRGHSNAETAFSLAWSPDGKHIAFDSHSHDDDVRSRIEVWEVYADKQILVYRGNRTARGHAETAIFFAWSPDGKSIASAGLNSNAVRVWDSHTGKDVFVSSKPGRFITNVAWSPDGKSIAYGPCHIGFGSGPGRGYWLRVLKLPDL